MIKDAVILGLLFGAIGGTGIGTIICALLGFSWFWYMVGGVVVILLIFTIALAVEKDWELDD